MAICSTSASSNVRKAKTSVCDAITANLILARVAGWNSCFPSSWSGTSPRTQILAFVGVARNIKIRVKVSKLKRWFDTNKKTSSLQYIVLIFFWVWNLQESIWPEVSCLSVVSGRFSFVHFTDWLCYMMHWLCSSLKQRTVEYHDPRVTSILCFFIGDMSLTYII